MSYLPLSAFLMFLGLGAPAVLLGWGRQVRVGGLVVRSIVVALVGSGGLWVAASPTGWAPLGVITAVSLAIYQALDNRAAARELVPTQASTAASLNKSFAAWGPLASLALWFYLAFFPLLTTLPRIGSMSVALTLGILAFPGLMVAWITSTYRAAMLLRNRTSRRQKDSLFGSLYAYYGLIGSAVILMGCHQWDIAHQARSLNFFTTGIWVATGLFALGMFLCLVPERNFVLRWLPTAAFAGAGGLVAAAIESLGVPELAPLAVGLVVALALVDAILSNSHGLHRVRVTLPRLVRVVAPALVGAMGLYWYLARIWDLRDGGRSSSADQAAYLIIVGLVTLVSLTLVTHQSVAQSGSTWMTENSGTFNVSHDLLLTYACVLLGVVMPFQLLLFSELADLIGLIILLMFGGAGTGYLVVRFAIRNYQRHATHPAVTLVSEIPELDGDERKAWDARMRWRQIRQVVGLVGIAVCGWTYMAYALLVVGRG
jgi:hypothetical protein